ncbi:hypothetical protein FH609_008830 [Streptomyces sp. 3MP-14]|uniref:Uncharacterized protein n=1 Tax=Streptomyces mimosae TaxID=2586635 RepID=A0A5N6AKF8_9ACTN|nr:MULTISPECIES: hypothetical protein [Streptomyces]KAB8168526.1 hypothetical protein FH607_004535 [Streptomyces mimosae]KAB8178193.1 hypothetical protein FH609_008830 [Streptomyces sp. 3MP-14]
MATQRVRTAPLALGIAVVADVAAAIIGLWILLYLLDANPQNDLVNVSHDISRWLATWSHDLFTFDKEWARVVCGYGLAAVVYLALGNLIANRVRRF